MQQIIQLAQAKYRPILNIDQAARDRRVNLADFNVLAASFGQSLIPGVTNRSSDKGTTDADDLRKLLEELI